MRIENELNMLDDEFRDFSGLDEFLNCVNQDLNDFTILEISELINDLQHQHEACQALAESTESISNELSKKLDEISEMIKSAQARKTAE